MDTIEKLKPFFKSWPPAADPHLICNPDNEKEKIDRGENIISFFLNEPLKEKKFLDFGCGEGHAVAAAKQAQIAIGYDTNHCENDIWKTYSIFSDFNEIIKNGPFDIILAYDVLDHSTDPVDCVRKIRAVSKPGTTIYFYCHPWCSRHGGHLYHKYNYAYLHFFLNDEEIIKEGMQTLPQKVVNPIMSYDEWFQQGGLEPSWRTSKYIASNHVPKFFQAQHIAKHITKRFATFAAFKQLPLFQMGQDWHEYTYQIK